MYFRFDENCFNGLPLNTGDKFHGSSIGGVPEGGGVIKSLLNISSINEFSCVRI